MKKIDLNADIAEGFPFDEALLKLLSSANIACGLHAGGAKEMQSAVRFWGIFEKIINVGHKRRYEGSFLVYHTGCEILR